MQTFVPRRAAVESRHGMVAAQHLGAAQAGARVLAAGGNAVDAAVVTALMLSVVEPWLSGVGGGGFLLHADPARSGVDTLDFNMIAPIGLDPGDYPLARGQETTGNWFQWPAVAGQRNINGYSSICVPGAVAGLAAALERFGTLSFAQALEPAIEAAETGMEVDWFAAMSIANEASTLALDGAAREIFLPGGRAPRISERGAPVRVPMPRKAQTLRRLASAGARDFYEGEVARALVADLQAGGACIGPADLAAYQPRWDVSQCLSYRGLDVHVMGGLSGGPTLLQILQSWARQGLGTEVGPEDLAVAHAQAIRDAYAWRLAHMGHAATPQAGCTSHVSVVDSNGRMVSLTNTLLARFGSKVVLPQTGFLMNNGMMWFDPRPGRPNSLAAGARPLANMCPVVVTRAGEPWLALGAAGGRTIVPAVAQLLSLLIDRGCTLEQAFNHPRVEASTASVLVSDQAPASVVSALRARFATEVVADTVYPVQFAVPSAVMRDAGRHTGMAHPLHPWAGVARVDAGAAAT